MVLFKDGRQTGPRYGRVEQLDQENCEQTDRQTNKQTHPTVTNAEMPYYTTSASTIWRDLGQQASWWFVSPNGWLTRFIYVKRWYFVDICSNISQYCIRNTRISIMAQSSTPDLCRVFVRFVSGSSPEQCPMILSECRLSRTHLLSYWNRPIKTGRIIMNRLVHVATFIKKMILPPYINYRNNYIINKNYCLY